MNYLSRISLFTSIFTKRACVAILAFLYTVMVPLTSSAEDIEIYEGLSGDIVQSSLQTSQKPNIVMLLDTSGSMVEPEVVFSPRPAYDESIDYGSSAADDVFVYTDDRVYTGMTVSNSDNQCNASKDFFTANSQFPEYVNKALVWAHQPASSTSEQVCTDGISVTGSATTSNRGWRLIDTVPVTPGDEISIRHDVGANTVYKDADFVNASGNRIQNVCGDYVAANTSDDCTGITVPSNAVGIEIWFYNLVSSSTTVSFELTTGETCTTQVVTRPESADWVVQAEATDTIVALECEADSGIHGRNSSSLGVYAQYISPGHSNLSNSNYTKSAGNQYAVDWNEDSVLTRILVPGNYHDYLQSSTQALIGAATVHTITGSNYADVTAYCKTEASPWIDVGSYTVPNFPNAEKYVLHDGSYYLCQRRISALKQATSNILSSISGANIGIMRFNHEEGGSLISRVQDADLSTGSVENRDALITKVKSLPAVGATPLSESLYEAYRYYAGLAPTAAYKTAEKRVTVDANSTIDFPTNLTLKTSSIIDSAAVNADGKYISPIINHCQDNNVILFSDGSASLDVGAGSGIRAFAGGSCSDSIHGDCLDDLADGMSSRDVNTDVDLDNHVYLHTIGFGSDISGSSQLIDASNKGLRPGAAEDSQHYEASNAEQLTSAFQSILLSLENVQADSFTAPAVAVNAFNRLQFRNELYFALFEPSRTSRWDGNIKKYKVNSDGEIIDVKGLNAVDNSGFFHDNAVSFWDNVVDGNVVQKGGVVEQLDISPARKLYANLKSTVDTVHALPKASFLSLIENTTLSGVMSLGAKTTPDLVTNRNNIVNWTLGEDVDLERDGAATDPNHFLGESLHGTPYVVDFGTSSTPKDMLFFTTNQGMLHAVNGQSGDEEWAYIPDPALFPNLGAYYHQTLDSDHVYGLDGEMEVVIERAAVSRNVNKAHLFFGQRRGGEKYFAVDVTNAYSDATGKPMAKLWTVSDLPRQAQSWAKPVAAKINYCNSSGTCGIRDVLVISGGYDTKYDTYEFEFFGATIPISVASRAGNVDGNAIYIVDQATGALLWMAGRNSSQVDATTGAHGYFTNDEMKHSFPTEPTVVDTDFDGVADLMFAIDISGKVWRFDFRGDVSTSGGVITIDDNDIHANNNNSSKEVAGGIIADLSESGKNRRFFNKLDVSITPRTANDLARFNLVTGSGYRAHPLLDEGTQNRLYFVFDRNVTYPKFKDLGSDGLPDAISYNYVSSSERIEANDLDEKTNSITLDSSPSGAHHHGFYLDLAGATSEKLLNPTLTDDGMVIAVSYSPTSTVVNATGDTCEKNIGSSSLYLVDLYSGFAARKDLNKAGISTKPVVIEIADEDNPGETVKVLIIGSESFDGSAEMETNPDGDIAKLIKPGLNLSDVGKVKKVNWWERKF